MKLTYRYFLAGFFVCVFFWSSSPFVYAQNCRLIEDKGLRGEELICLAAHPQDKNILFVGTSRGLYMRRAPADAWQAVEGLPQSSCCVYQVLFEGQTGYAATSRGLFELDANNFCCRNIFDRSDDKERDCLSICVLENGVIFAGTRCGLFLKKKDQKNWTKVTSLFNDEEITCLAAAGNSAYALTASGVYRAKNYGKTWEKAFDVFSYGENSYETEDTGDGEVETTRGDITYMAVSSCDANIIYAVGKSGVFLTEDGGGHWRRLSLTGLEYSDLRFIKIGAVGGKVFIVSKNNVYELIGSQWRPVAGFYDCRQVEEVESGLIVLTGRDIFECEIKTEDKACPDEKDGMKNILASFAYEPTVQEVQKKAIEYSETSNKKIMDWRRRANVKAMMPKLTFGYDNNVYGSYNGCFAVGPNSWDVNVSWDLAELVYNNEQTSIDTRSKLMVQLRNDILAEVTSLFFERRRLQVELMANKALSEQEKMDKKLRVLELTALLDRLTGGFYSESLQKGQKP